MRRKRSRQSAPAARTPANAELERAAGLRGVAKREDGQVGIVGDVVLDDLDPERDARGPRALAEVDLVGSPQIESLVEPGRVARQRARGISRYP